MLMSLIDGKFLSFGNKLRIKDEIYNEGAYKRDSGKKSFL